MASQPHPLVYFWIAHYNDGTYASQFDLNTFKENSIKIIDNSKLIKVGWYPIPYDLAVELNKRGIPAISNPLLPKIEVEINKNKRFILFMRNFISIEEFRICENCGKEFQAIGNIEFFGDKHWRSPICPHCGGHDYWQCKKCGTKYDLFSATESTSPEKGGYGHCPKCGGYLELIRVTSKQYTRERRWRLYVVGFQETIGGKNYKVMLYADENGNVEMKYD